MGEKHLPRLDTIVDPILISGLTTVVWSPHGHAEALDSLLRLANVVLLDSVAEPVVASSLARVSELAGRAYVVDLAWLRSTPWRERVAFTFDPAGWRPELQRISAVTVRHRADSAVAALLLVGWLSSRLGWEPAALARRARRAARAGAQRAARRWRWRCRRSRARGPRPRRSDAGDDVGARAVAGPRAGRAGGGAPDAVGARFGVDGARRLAR